MDPNTALRDALSDMFDLANGGIAGVKDSDLRGTLCANLDALSSWIKRGGFPPAVSVFMEDGKPFFKVKA